MANHSIETYRSAYKKLNQSFSKQAIYPLTNRGFYSEINNLALAVLYCLDQKIALSIDTKKWVSGRWHYYFKPDTLKEYSGIASVPARSVFDINRYEKPLVYYHTKIKNRRLAQGDLWLKMRSKDFIEKSFSIPELGIEGSIFQAKKQVLQIILDYNDTVLKALSLLKNETYNFISDSCAIHVRRGDKVAGKTKEAEAFDISNYITKALSKDTSLTKFTICTDDYAVVEEFKSTYPDYEFLTLCEPSKKGYSQEAYNNVNEKADQEEEVIGILKDAYLLTEAKLFIGAYSSNISRYIVLERDDKHCYSMDIDWHAV